MSDYEILNLVIGIIGIVLTAILVGINIKKTATSTTSSLVAVDISNLKLEVSTP